MEHIFLLYEIIPHRDLAREVLKKTLFILSDFEYGRMYQLVSDKSANIKAGKYTKRVQECEPYMDSLTFEQVVEEAYTIVAQRTSFRERSSFYSSRERKEYTEWYDLGILDTSEREDNFYFGRCVQFIIDTDNKKLVQQSLSKAYKIVVIDAHYMRQEMLLPTEYDVLDFGECDCGQWTVGENRCQCGNRRCCIEQTSWIDSLDDSEIFYYVTTR